MPPPGAVLVARGGSVPEYIRFASLLPSTHESLSPTQAVERKPQSDHVYLPARHASIWD